MRKILSIITIGLLTVVFCSTQSFGQTGKWTQMFPANSPPARSSNGIAYLGDDKILLFGGWKLHDKVLGDTWIYDLSDNEWTEVKCDTSPRARELPAMVHIADGKVLLFGGYLGWDYDLGNDTWIFDLKTMKWKEFFPTKNPAARDRAVCAYYEENKALLFGGNGKLDFCDDTWIYDLEKNEWDSITNHFPRGRELAQMCEINSNDFALYSGNTANYNTMTPDVFIFSKNSNTWRRINLIKPNKYRDATSMVKLVDNVAFVFGGNSEDSGKTSDDNWVLLIEDSTWIQLNLENHPERRYYNYMATIGEGKALLFGGIGYSSDLNDTWIFEYDPTGVKDSSNFLFAQVTIINKSNNLYEIRISNLCKGNINVELYDITGDLVKQIYSSYNLQTDFNFDINTDNINSGNYFLVIKTKEANYYKQIMIVQ